MSPPLPPAVAGLTSVVTVNFDAGPLLVACVKAVLSSRTPVEHVVVDNGSTDGSVAMLKAALPGETRLLVVEAGANLGFARASNLGIRSARGDLILLLNPDCLVEPDTIGRMRAVMDERPEAGMAGCLLLNPDGTEQAGCRRAVPTPWRSLVRTLGLSRLTGRRRVFDDFVLTGQPLPAGPTPVDAISGAFMLVRRAALERVGALDEGYFLHCEDLDWCMRFREAGLTVLFVPGVTVVHHKGHSSRARPVRVLWHMHRGMIRFYGKFFRDRYPLPMMWLVYAGVWLRFGAAALRALVTRRRASA